MTWTPSPSSAGGNGRMGTRTEDRLPAAFRIRMQAQLGDAYPLYLSAMEQPQNRAFRVNTLKITEESFRNLVDFTIIQKTIINKLEISSARTDDISNSCPACTQLYENTSVSTNDITNSGMLATHSLEISSKSLSATDDITNMPPSDLVLSSSFLVDFSNTCCYFFPNDVAIGKHPLHITGLIYVQEPSAQLPAQLLDVRPGMTVLDLCAAPGGKTGQLAAAMENTGLLIANEPIPARAEVLVGNVERLGIKNCVVTSMLPDALCPKLAGLCDAVLVDAPCSGEGMFRRDAGAIADWSPAHVEACAVRQRAILDAADLALRPGGSLVYATCTFSPDENEETVATFLSTHPNYRLLAMQRLYPHTSAGEGQFMAKLVKEAPSAEEQRPPRNTPKQSKRTPSAEKPCPAWEAFQKETFSAPITGRALALPDGRVLLPPAGFDQLPQCLRILRAGVLLGEVRSGRFLPAHALAMATEEKTFQRCVPLDGVRLSACLAGETVPCDPAYSGFCAVTYAGFPLCFGKAVDGTLKNHLPKGLRIRN